MGERERNGDGRERDKEVEDDIRGKIKNKEKEKNVSEIRNTTEVKVKETHLSKWMEHKTTTCS